MPGGLKVFGEIGSEEKETEEQTLITLGQQSLDAGACLLLIEGVCHHQIETLSKLLVRERGSDVNLGNVAPGRIIDLECIQCRLGGEGPPVAGT